jgi:hypothetical protein
VVDATDFFTQIIHLSAIGNDLKSHTPQCAVLNLHRYNNIHTLDMKPLKTFSYPYTHNPLKPGSVLFWKPRKPNFPYGHCALIVQSDENETIIIQQNLNPPIKRYNTKELFAKMNRPDSTFLGIKTVPFRLPKVVYNVIKI